MTKTVSIEFLAGQVRDRGGNHGTRIAPVRRLPPRPARDLFLGAYARFAPSCRAVDEPGVAVVAIDETTGAPAGIACLRARVDRHVAAIVGRHDRCDLYLPAHAALALRQLAVVVSPLRDVGDVSFRLLDLHTGAGILDEEGRPLRGLRAEGPALVRCGGYLVLALPLGDPTDWPASAADAWACLPERVYFDELAHPPDGSVVMPVRDRHTTVVTRIRGPVVIDRSLVAGDLAGTLHINGAPVEVGHEALRTGVLLGRYDRCGAQLVADPSLSRVHALLVQLDDRLLVVDTASTFGTRMHGRDARVFEITHGSELELAEETRVRWTWVA